MTALDELIAALRMDMDQLLKVAEREDNRNRQAALRLAVNLIGTTVDKFADADPEPEPSAWPDDWDDFATCVRCGRRNPPMLVTTHGGLMCHPACPPSTALYTVKGGDTYGDLVIEVPADITAPGDVATYLVVRLTALTRPLIDAELYVDWMVSLHDDYPGAPAPFASLSIDGHKSVQYPLIEAPRGGAL